MALTVRQRQQFHHWMIKSFSGPFLAILALVVGSLFPETRLNQPIIALSCFLFGGFPLGNIIFEEKKGFLLVYHGSHFVLSLFPIYYLKSHYFLPPPVDCLLFFCSWLWVQAGLMLIMPQTAQRVESYRLWRHQTIQKIVKAHY